MSLAFGAGNFERLNLPGNLSLDFLFRQGLFSLEKGPMDAKGINDRRHSIAPEHVLGLHFSLRARFDCLLVDRINVLDPESHADRITETCRCTVWTHVVADPDFSLTKLELSVKDFALVLEVCGDCRAEDLNVVINGCLSFAVLNRDAWDCSGNRGAHR